MGVRDVGVLGLSQSSDQLVLLLDQRSQINAPGEGGDPGEGIGQCDLAGAGSGQQRLGRDAPDVHAGAADGAVLDHQHRPAGLASGDSGRHGCPAGAHHRQIEFETRFHQMAPLFLRSLGWTFQRTGRSTQAVSKER